MMKKLRDFIFIESLNGSRPLAFICLGLLLSFIPGQLYAADTDGKALSETQESIDGGTLSEEPFFFCVGDGVADNVSRVSVEGAVGPNRQWVVTDDTGLILGLPPRPEAVDFDTAGPGVCLIWHLSFADGLQGLEAGNNLLSDLSGTYDLSDDNVRVYRSQPEGGQLTGGPYEFTVGDGITDNVANVQLSGNSGDNSQWVVTDDTGLILGLPPTPGAVDFDIAGPGVCLIWHLSFADGLQGLEAGNNALTDLVGCYDLSNEVRVVRNEVVNTTRAQTVMFPLPAKEILNVALGSRFQKGENTVYLYDFAGNDLSGLLQKIDAPDGMSFDVQSLPIGIYVMRIQNSNGPSLTQKVMIR